MLYIFEHIPKTAGTSFNGYLRSAFPVAAATFITGHMPEMADDIARISGATDADLARTRVISGHSAGQLRGRFPDARFITMVREPLARLYSAHQHHLNYPGALDRFGWAADISLDEFATVPGEADVLSTTLLGEAHHDIDSMSDVEIADLLHARYHLIGNSARMEQFVYALHKLAGFPLALFANQNERARHWRKTIIASEELLEAVRKDMRVYQIVERGFEQRFQAACDPTDSRIFDLYSQALAAFAEDGDINRPGFLFSLPVKDQISTELALSDFRPAGDRPESLCGGDGAVTVRTGPEPWSYSAALPFSADLLNPRGLTFVELDLCVTRGQIAVATACRSDDACAEQRQFEGTSTKVRAIVPIAPGVSQPLIVIRNGETWRPGLVRIEGVRVVSTSLTGASSSDWPQTGEA